MGTTLQIIQSLAVLLLAPLYAMMLSRAEAIVQCKRGPRIVGPYRDLYKLLGKGNTVS